MMEKRTYSSPHVYPAAAFDLFGFILTDPCLHPRITIVEVCHGIARMH